MMKIQFGPSICENYSLIPELWKITNWSLKPIPRFWTELNMNYGQNYCIVMKI
jgi:hypothetical protein